MFEGKIRLLFRFGMQGGYGVILCSNQKEFIFTLGDVRDYAGGNLTDAGYKKEAEVVFDLKTKGHFTTATNVRLKKR